MIYIYREGGSNGARDLAHALGARRVRRTQALRNLRATDHIVCWGETSPQLRGGVAVLNGHPLRNKFIDATALHEAGVPTVEVRQERPRLQPPQLPQPDPALIAFQATRGIITQFLDATGVRGLETLRDGDARRIAAELEESLRAFQVAVQQPPPRPRPAANNEEWLPRINGHIGGHDLLMPPAYPNFWVRRENIVSEYRVHSFLGRSIRAGMKVPRTGVAHPHEWVRSWDSGWRISYAEGNVMQAHRDLAHRAVQALGLDFGAVDIGRLDGGNLIVLEVNRAPGLEGGTITAYARAIQQWADGR